MSTAFDNIYPIGLGTARFPFARPDTYETDFENAVGLVLYALERGVNYFDVGRDYSKGHALSVLREAFRRSDQAYNVTIKLMSYDRNIGAEEHYQEGKALLRELGIERASHFLLWSLMDAGQFRAATRKGGLYDAALRMKDEGLVRHIGASVHMRPDEALEVIDSGLVEFILISYHLLNFMEMQPFLDRVAEKDVDILVMNPLYGGLIPENERLFEYARRSEEETVVQAAMRAVLAHPAVKCVPVGASTKAQLDEYLSAVQSPGFDLRDMETRSKRLAFIREHMTEAKSLCTYCRYCADCPAGIPVPQLMNARNVLSLQQNGPAHSAERLYFQVLHQKFDVKFESAENPCLKCGQCERKCTQHLPVMEAVDEVYRMAGRTGYDWASRKRRFDELFDGKGYEKVGFWPASGGTNKILNIYRELYGDFPFEVFLFDSNVDYHGTKRFGYTVHAGDEAAALGVDCILITSYGYGKTIFDQISYLQTQGIDVKLLYRDGDVDWWW